VIVLKEKDFDLEWKQLKEIYGPETDLSLQAMNFATTENPFYQEEIEDESSFSEW
jgi:hypothetical protein